MHARRTLAGTALAFLLALTLSCAKAPPGRPPDSAGEAAKPGAEPKPPATTAETPSLPEFPWPPPRASASMLLSDALQQPQGRPSTLGDAAKRLSDALDRTGYVEKSYLGVPHGFALVSRLEQINADGTPKAGNDRWSVAPPRMKRFSLRDYIAALMYAAPGYYRVLAFLVTDQPFSQAPTSVTGEEAQRWLSGGENVLPRQVAELPYTSDYNCTALVYEFRRRNAAPDVLVPGRLDGATHIRKSGLYAALYRRD